MKSGGKNFGLWAVLTIDYYNFLFAQRAAAIDPKQLAETPSGTINTPMSRTMVSVMGLRNYRGIIGETTKAAMAPSSTRKNSQTIGPSAL